MVRAWIRASGDEGLTCSREGKSVMSHHQVSSKAWQEIHMEDVQKTVVEKSCQALECGKSRLVPVLARLEASFVH